MEDKTYLSAFIYIFIVFGFSGFIPSDIYSPNGQAPDSEELRNSINLTGQTVAEGSEQVGFFKRAVTFLFVPFLIPGIPSVLGLFVAGVNYLAVIIGSVFLYDKLRGI